MAIAQRWECPICSAAYESPVRVSEVLCPNTHPSKGRGRSGRGMMKLVSGEPTKGKKR